MCDIVGSSLCGIAGFLAGRLASSSSASFHFFAASDLDSIHVTWSIMGVDSCPYRRTSSLRLQFGTAVFPESAVLRISNQSLYGSVGFLKLQSYG